MAKTESHSRVALPDQIPRPSCSGPIELLYDVKLIDTEWAPRETDKPLNRAGCTRIVRVFDQPQKIEHTRRWQDRVVADRRPCNGCETVQPVV